MTEILVLIPAYCAQNTILKLAESVKEKGLDILVVNDGARDNTGKILVQNNINHITHKKNSGKGEALKTGFAYAVEKGYDAVITMDSDMQHLPSDIDNFLKAYKNSRCGFFIGNRLTARKSMPYIRYLTNKFMSFIISQMIKIKVSDTQCGFRLIKTDIIKQIKLETSGYDTESEMIFKAARAGFEIRDVPIETVYIKKNRSYIKPLKDTVKFIKLAAEFL